MTDFQRNIIGLVANQPDGYLRAQKEKELYEKAHMSFAEIVKLTNPPLDVYCEFHKNKTLQLETEATTIRMTAAPEKFEELSRNGKLVLESLKGESWIMHLEILMQVEVFGGGPKVFRPTAHQLFMLEKMNLNLTSAEFQMPFKAIVVELPAEYIAARATKTHKPFVSVLFRDRVFIHSLWSSKFVVKSWWRPEADDTPIENWFEGKYSEYVDPRSLPTDEAEGHMEQLVRRAALNYCLLLDEVGIKRTGPASPNQYNQLVKWCAKNNKHTAKNKIELQTSPMLYAMAADTQLVRMVDTLPKEEGLPTGRVVSPHCRRGHYRMQPYGIQGMWRKRIRIPPIMVNAHMLASGLIPPTKVYKT